MGVSRYRSAGALMRSSVLQRGVALVAPVGLGGAPVGPLGAVVPCGAEEPDPTGGVEPAAHPLAMSWTRSSGNVNPGAMGAEARGSRHSSWLYTASARLCSPLREAWSPVLALGRPDLDFAAITDVGLFSQAADAVVSIVNEGIGDASERTAVVVDPERGPLWFMADPHTRDLLTFVYLQLQTLVTGLVPLRTCADPECGRSFTPDDPRARYCQPAHGNRTRARRSRRRVTAAGEGDDLETRT